MRMCWCSYPPPSTCHILTDIDRELDAEHVQNGWSIGERAEFFGLPITEFEPQVGIVRTRNGVLGVEPAEAA